MSLMRFYCYFHKHYIMRGMYHDQVSNNFIEGPIQSEPVNNSLQQGTADNAVYKADMIQDYESDDDVNKQNILYDDTNERYD